MGTTDSGIIYPDPADVPQRADLQALAESADVALGTGVAAALTASAVQTIPNSSFTDLEFQIQTTSGGTSADSTSITLNRSGMWLLTSNVQGNLSGRLILRIAVNGSQVCGDSDSGAGGAVYCSAVAILPLDAGDVITAEMHQNSGSSQDITTNRSLGAARLGSVST